MQASLLSPLAFQSLADMPCLTFPFLALAPLAHTRLRLTFFRCSSSPPFQLQGTQGLLKSWWMT